jgi:transcriptional regulator GlxA family with amidase domain
MSHRVNFVIFPGFQLLDAAGPIAVFEVASDICPGHYRVEVCAPEGGVVPSSAGVQWAASKLPRAGAFDTLVLAGGDGVDDVIAQPTLLAWLRKMAKGDARMASICSGSLWLAAAGLLDDKAATTHWGRTQQLRNAYPRVRLQPDQIYTRDGRIWTSAGVTAGIDLALAMVAADLGEPVARKVAQQLVVYFRRPGGQSQFSSMLELGRSDGRFGPLLDHVRANLSARFSVEDLAEYVCMSARHFARAFLAETGCTPAKAIDRLRAEAARAQLESGTTSVQEVARESGYANPEQMRRSFMRSFGMAPSAIRRLG